MGSVGSKVQERFQTAKTPEKVKLNTNTDTFSTPQLPPTLDQIEEQPFDPRSPGIFRTPMEVAMSPKTRITKMKNLRDELNESNEFISPCKVLRDRLIHNLPYDLMDPRSPSTVIPRTPLAFKVDDAAADGCLSVEYAEVSSDSLIVDTEITVSGEVETAEIKPYLETNFDEIEADVKTTQHTEKPNDETEIDPRSPSVDIKRTPIILSHLLAEESVKAVSSESTRKIALRNLKKQQKIYVDTSGDVATDTTPKRGIVVLAKRTPLGCVANKSSAHIRSKSAENLTKSKHRQFDNENSDWVKETSQKIAALNWDSSINDGNDENTPRNAMEMRKMITSTTGKRGSSKIPVLRFN